MLPSRFVADSFILQWKKNMEVHLTWGLYHSKSTVQFYNDSLLDSIALTFFSNNPPTQTGLLNETST